MDEKLSIEELDVACTKGWALVEAEGLTEETLADEFDKTLGELGCAVSRYRLNFDAVSELLFTASEVHAATISAALEVAFLTGLRIGKAAASC